MSRKLQTGFVSSRSPGEVFSAHLYNGADTEMDIDGTVSAGPITFRHTVPAGEVHFMFHIVIHLLDGTVNLDQFGGIGTLSEGVLLCFYNSNDELILDPTDGHPIVDLSDFSIFTGIFLDKTVGNVNDVFIASWAIKDTYGGPIRMGPGDYIQLTIQDDLTELTEFHIFVHGSKIVNSS